MSNTGLPSCYRHPKRETAISCSRCGKPACSECLRPAPVGQHCLDCIREASPAAKVRVQRASRSQVAHFRANAIPATNVLIAVNVAVFVAGLVGVLPREAARFGLFGPLVDSGEYYRVLTSGFIHAGLLHVFMNMFILLQLGRFLEPALGWRRFSLLYFVGLFGGSLGALFLEPGVLTVGASGAVFGLAGAATVALRQRGVSFANTGWGPMLLMNLVFTFMIPGISKGGHLGGLFFGAIGGAIVMHPKRRNAIANDAILALICVIAVLGALTVAKAR